jgi:hypothetical protein
MAALATGRAAVLLATDAAAVTAADVAVAATTEAARVATTVIANAPTVQADAITTALEELEAVKLSLKNGDEVAIAAANANGQPAAVAAGAAGAAVVAVVATAAAEAAATAVLVAAATATAKEALVVAAALEVDNAGLFLSDTDFWDAQKLTLPTWWAASDEIALISLSSASAERLFSLLTQGFDSSQYACLSDYKFASVAIRDNKTGENINFM